MRLIDADDLKVEIRKAFPSLYMRCEINTIINTRPTIEPKQADDLISRADAIDAIHCDISVVGRQNAEIVAMTIGQFVDRIKAIPSAQPKRGEWIVHKERTEVNDGFIDFFTTEYECSNCGLKQRMYFINSKPSNFCPNCGARMKGKDNE